MYIFGQGIDNADYAEAIRYFRLSAECGSVEGQSNVGLMYYSGRGMNGERCGTFFCYLFIIIIILLLLPLLLLALLLEQ
jgi:hypothetical protein